jgi:hypothetical protein
MKSRIGRLEGDLRTSKRLHDLDTDISQWNSSNQVNSCVPCNVYSVPCGPFEPSAMAGIGGMAGAMDGSNGPQGTEYTLQGTHEFTWLLALACAQIAFQSTNA